MSRESPVRFSERLGVKFPRPTHHDCFETLDLQWNEDSVPWFSGGIAIEVLSWFRLMAYNLLQLARRRHLRKKLPDGSLENPPQWDRLFEWVKQAWVLPVPKKANTVCG